MRNFFRTSITDDARIIYQNINPSVLIHNSGYRLLNALFICNIHLYAGLFNNICRSLFLKAMTSVTALFYHIDGGFGEKILCGWMIMISVCKQSLHTLPWHAIMTPVQKSGEFHYVLEK